MWCTCVCTHNVVHMCMCVSLCVCVCRTCVCVHTCVSGGTSNKYTTLSKDYLSNMCSNIGKALHWGFPSILGFPLEAGGQPPSTPPCGVYKECWLLCSFSTQRAWGTWAPQQINNKHCLLFICCLKQVYIIANNKFYIFANKFIFLQSVPSLYII